MATKKNTKTTSTRKNTKKNDNLENTLSSEDITDSSTSQLDEEKAERLEYNKVEEPKEEPKKEPKEEPTHHQQVENKGMSRRRRHVLGY